MRLGRWDFRLDLRLDPSKLEQLDTSDLQTSLGNVITHNSRMDRHRVFKHGGKVGHVTRHVHQLFKVKMSKVKVTKSRDVSADKNAVTRQWTVISTSNLVRIIAVGVDGVVYFLGH